LALTSTSVELDLGEEVMESCLSFLQADPVEPYLAVLATVAETYDVRFHKYVYCLCWQCPLWFCLAGVLGGRPVG